MGLQNNNTHFLTLTTPIRIQIIIDSTDFTTYWAVGNTASELKNRHGETLSACTFIYWKFVAYLPLVLFYRAGVRSGLVS